MSHNLNGCVNEVCINIDDFKHVACSSDGQQQGKFLATHVPCVSKLQIFHFDLSEDEFPSAC